MKPHQWLHHEDMRVATLLQYAQWVADNRRNLPAYLNATDVAWRLGADRELFWTIVDDLETATDMDTRGADAVTDRPAHHLAAAAFSPDMDAAASVYRDKHRENARFLAAGIFTLALTVLEPRHECIQPIRHHANRLGAGDTADGADVARR